MEAVLFGDGDGRSTAWRGPEWEEGDIRLRLPCQAAASTQPRSMSALWTHLCADHQKMKDSSDGRDSRWSERCQEFRCDLETQGVHKVISSSLPIFRLLQASALLSVPFTPPQIFKHSDRSSELLNPLQCRCHSNSCELARWIRSGWAWTHSSSHTSSPSASEGGGALECPLMTAVPWFLMEDVVIVLSTTFFSYILWPTHIFFPYTSQEMFPPHFAPRTCFHFLLYIIYTFLINLLVTKWTSFDILSQCVPDAEEGTPLLFKKGGTGSPWWSALPVTRHLSSGALPAEFKKTGSPTRYISGKWNYSRSLWGADFTFASRGIPSQGVSTNARWEYLQCVL